MNDQPLPTALQEAIERAAKRIHEQNSRRVPLTLLEVERIISSEVVPWVREESLAEYCLGFHHAKNILTAHAENIAALSSQPPAQAAKGEG